MLDFLHDTSHENSMFQWYWDIVYQILESKWWADCHKITFLSWKKPVMTLRTHPLVSELFQFAVIL